MLPPRSLICIVTTASPTHTRAKTPEKTRSLCCPPAPHERNKLSSRQKMSGPHRSQSLRPSLMPLCRRASASGHLPAMFLKLPPSPSASPRSAAPMPPPLCIMPPSRYLGYSTCFIFSHIASRSRDSVSHTVSSMVLVGARRSSPGILDVKYDCVFAAPDRDDIFPVRGARSEVPCRGSSRSSRVAVGRQLMYSCLLLVVSRTIIRVNQIALDCILVVGVRRSRGGARHHGRHA
jgi:hypothetical protein